MRAVDGPARAIRSALAPVSTVRPLGITVRAGLHAGECEVIGEKIGGIAVHIGARVAAMAGPGEVLVSHTARDLVAGSGIRFEDRGTLLAYVAMLTPKRCSTMWVTPEKSCPPQRALACV